MLNRWARIGLDHGAAAVRKWWQSVIVSVLIAEADPIATRHPGCQYLHPFGDCGFYFGWVCGAGGKRGHAPGDD
jgi:hypothetical protein